MYMMYISQGQSNGHDISPCQYPTLYRQRTFKKMKIDRHAQWRKQYIYIYIFFYQTTFKAICFG